MPIMIFIFIIHLPSKDYDANEDDKDNPTYDWSKVSHPWKTWNKEYVLVFAQNKILVFA